MLRMREGRRPPYGSTKGVPSPAEATTAVKKPLTHPRLRTPGHGSGRSFRAGAEPLPGVVVVPVHVLLLSAMASFAAGTDIVVRSVAMWLATPS